MIEGVIWSLNDQRNDRIIEWSKGWSNPWLISGMIGSLNDRRKERFIEWSHESPDHWMIEEMIGTLNDRRNDRINEWSRDCIGRCCLTYLDEWHSTCLWNRLDVVEVNGDAARIGAPPLRLPVPGQLTGNEGQRLQRSIADELRVTSVLLVIHAPCWPGHRSPTVRPLAVTPTIDNLQARHGHRSI